MQGTANFIRSFFPLFLLGGVFGKQMDDSDTALSIARGIVKRLGETRAVMAAVSACAVLTYGGISLFVVAFAIYPIAEALFRQAKVPHRLFPPAMALGAFTFTMTPLPGCGSPKADRLEILTFQQYRRKNRLPWSPSYWVCFG